MRFVLILVFFSSRRRHTRFDCDWSSDVCSSDLDRYGRGGDHYPFYKAGLPAVRFTEPLEDYNHQHQTPRTEHGIEYGDYEKYLNFTDRKSTRLNSSHSQISYAVFCLKKKTPSGKR